MLEAFDTTEGKFSPDLGFFLNNLFFFLWESKRSCRHFFSSQKVGGFFFYLILCHACDWINQDLDKLVSIQRMTTLSCFFIRYKPVKTVHWVVLCLYESEIQSELAGYDIIQ